MVHRFVDSWKEEPGFRKDEFDGLSFGEILRLARLQELLEKLRANGVGVLTGTCVRYIDEENAETIIYVRFSELDEEVVRVDASGREDEADWTRGFVFLEPEETDDEIPF